MLECEFRLATIESEDGVHWRRPMLDLCPWPGHEWNSLFRLLFQRFERDSLARLDIVSSLFNSP